MKLALATKSARLRTVPAANAALAGSIANRRTASADDRRSHRPRRRFASEPADKRRAAPRSIEQGIKPGPSSASGGRSLFCPWHWRQFSPAHQARGLLRRSGAGRRSSSKPPTLAPPSKSSPTRSRPRSSNRSTASRNALSAVAIGRQRPLSSGSRIPGWRRSGNCGEARAGARCTGAARVAGRRAATRCRRQESGWHAADCPPLISRAKVRSHLADQLCRAANPAGVGTGAWRERNQAFGRGRRRTADISGSRKWLPAA